MESILTNEKYKGDARLQKKFTVDFLSKKVKVNEGEVPQYYVENSHPAIIAPEVFDLVQYEWKQRKADGHWTSSAHPFSGKVFCGECGGQYGSKVWDSNTEYRRLIWQCNNKYKGGHCHTPHLTESEIKAAFLSAFNAILNERTEILAAYNEVIEALTDTSDLDTERGELQNEADVVTELIKKAISENAHKAQDQEEYQHKYEGYCARFEKARNRLAEIEDICLECNAKKVKIQMFMERMGQYAGLVTEFDEELWYSMVDMVTVFEDKRMVFTFRDGTQVTIKKEAWQAA